MILRLKSITQTLKRQIKIEMVSQLELFDFNPGKSDGAVISSCNRYRFQLWRIWDTRLPKVLWIMHNPSIADASNDDPTIRRITQFTKDWGYGGLYVGNMFPYRSTDPKNLLGKPFSEIAPLENIRHINEMKSKCDLFILAYGNPVIKDAVPEFFDEDWMALKFTKSGNPCHPLYLSSKLQPKKFSK